MAQVSVGQAIGAGFRVLGRNPGVVLAWAAALFVLGVLPQVAVFASVFPAIIGAYQEAARTGLQGGHPSPDVMAGLNARFIGLQPVSSLASLVSHTVLLGAVYRAVLEPENRRFAYLRLGIQELWLGLAILVMVIGAVLVAVAVAIPLAVVAAIVAAAGRAAGGAPGVAGLLVVAIALAGVGVVVWAMIRFSLALPMGFAQRNFRFFESWSLTRGHAFQIFLVYFAVLLIAFLVELALLAVFGVGFLGVAAAGWRSLLSARPEEILRRIAPWIPVWMVVAAVVGAVLQALISAPVAEIYRELSAEPEPA